MSSNLDPVKGNKPVTEPQDTSKISKGDIKGRKVSQSFKKVGDSIKGLFISLKNWINSYKITSKKEHHVRKNEARANNNPKMIHLFRSIFSKTKKLTEKDVAERFDNIEKQTKDFIGTIKYRPTYGENKAASRFENIQSPDHSKLEAYPSLHANNIKTENGNYIAAQVPEQGEDVEAFWRAAASESGTIVDLTNDKDQLLVEGQNFSQEKYYPEGEGKTSKFGETTIEFVDSYEENGIIETLYNVKTGDEESKTVKRIHYKQWPDHGVPQIDSFTTLVNKVNDLELEKPPIVHCRAGVGRTGAFIVASQVLKMKKNNTISKNDVDQLDKMVLQGRKDRDPQFVQTEGQYQLLVNMLQK